MKTTHILAGCLLAAVTLLPAGCAGTQSAAKRETAPAATTAEPKAAQAAVVGDPNDPTICKSDADSTTRVRKYKICKTKSEWDAISNEARRQVERIQTPGSDSSLHCFYPMVSLLVGSQSSYPFLVRPARLCQPGS